METPPHAALSHLNAEDPFVGAARARLSVLAATGEADLTALLCDAEHLGKLHEAATTAARRRDFFAPALGVDAYLRRALGRDVTDPDRRTTVAALTLRLADWMWRQPPPASIMALYPSACGQLRRFLERPIQRYDPDFYAKDVRFALGLSLPGGGGRAIDAHFPVSVWATALRLATAGAAADIPTLLNAKPWRPWLQAHIDKRDMSGFNPEGWNQTYRLIADLLQMRPEVAGVMGSCWYYDPQVRRFAPHLAYLQDTPVAGGAILVRLGPGDIHTQRAIAGAPDRRRAVEAGEYRPVCYSVLWPREAIIRWAECATP